MKLIDKDKLEKLKKLADAMYYAAQHLTTDASRLHKSMEEYHQFIINEYHKEEQTIPDIVDKHFDEMLGEDPVSEDLEKELSRLLKDCEIDSEYIHQDFLHIVANHFADWQKERMMKDAVNGLVYAQRTNGEVMFRSNYVKKEGFEFGDKVKVLVIKEEIFDNVLNMTEPELINE